MSRNPKPHNRTRHINYADKNPLGRAKSMSLDHSTILGLLSDAQYQLSIQHRTNHGQKQSSYYNAYHSLFSALQRLHLIHSLTEPPPKRLTSITIDNPTLNTMRLLALQLYIDYSNPKLLYTPQTKPPIPLDWQQAYLSLFTACTHVLAVRNLYHDPIRPPKNPFIPPTEDDSQ